MNNTKPLPLKEIQKESLVVLLKIDDICKKNGWNYCLAYGTLLGAVRHKGFIPWDDDVDIWMPRKDFDLFCEWCKEHSDEIKPFSLASRGRTKNYYYGIPRFSNLSFKYVSTFESEKEFELGAFVDIYPLDNACDSNKKTERLFKRIKFLNKSASAYVNIKSIFGLKHSIIKFILYIATHIAEMITYLKYSGGGYISMVESHIKYLLDKYTSVNSSEIGLLCWEEKLCLFSRDLFSEYMPGDFEGYTLPIPLQFDKILTQIYGDYMQLPPEEQRIPYHGYEIYPRI